MTKPWIRWNTCADQVVPPDIRAKAEEECARVIALLDEADPNHIRKVQTCVEMAWAWAHSLALSPTHDGAPPDR